MALLLLGGSWDQIDSELDLSCGWYSWKVFWEYVGKVADFGDFFDVLYFFLFVNNVG